MSQPVILSPIHMPRTHQTARHAEAHAIGRRAGQAREGLERPHQALMRLQSAKTQNPKRPRLHRTRCCVPDLQSQAAFRPPQGRGQPIVPTQCPHERAALDLIAGIAAFCHLDPMIGDHGKRGLAHGVPHSSDLTWLVCRPGARRNRGRGETQGGINQTAPKIDRCRWRVAPNATAGATIDVIAVFRGPVSGILGGLFPEKVGSPIKPAALTQGSVRIRQTDLAAVW
jgi:hypothetical protein